MLLLLSLSLFFSFFFIIALSLSFIVNKLLNAPSVDLTGKNADVW